MLPSLDLDTEITAIRTEIKRTIDACAQTSGRELAALRREYMQQVVERINAALGFGTSREPAPPD